MACYSELIVKFFGLALLFNSLPILHAQDEEDVLDKVAVVPGDFIIAALFSVHEAPSNLYDTKCGPIQDQAGMQRVEAAIWELKRINEENKLKNYAHTFGLEIRDTCGFDLYAFQQLLFIYNCVQNRRNKPIVGIVGPAFLPEIRITREWIDKHLHQIGFSATPPRMTNKKYEFENFARLVPPDTHQARVIFDLIDYFGQGCVNTIITAGVYGSDAVKAFMEITKSSKTKKNNTLCVGSREIVYHHTTEDELKKILVNSTQFSGMVVCFCEGRTLRKLYQIADKVGLKDQVLFINGDGLTETDNMIDFQKDIIDSIMINPSPQLKIEDNFADYYYNLSNWNPSENPWKEEFYKHRFNCSFNESNKTRNCTGHEALEKDFLLDPKLPLVRYSIRAIADAINHFVDDVCRHSKMECDKNFTMKDFENFSSHFLNYSRDKNFEFGKNTSFLFNEKDDPFISKYEILSYAKQNGSFTFQVIGNWNDVNGLVMNENLSHLFNKYKIIENKCNMPCKTGYYRAMKNCCWKCTKCNRTSISNGSIIECINCEICKRSNEEGTECVDKTSDLVNHQNMELVYIFGSFPLFGVAFTSFTAYVFYKHRRTPVVKLASIHLSLIILCGMGLAYSTMIFSLIEPNVVTCTILRFLPSISLTMIYGPMLIRMNRISRAMAATKTGFPKLRVKYLSPTFLTSASLVFVLVDIIVCMVQFIIVISEGRMHVEPNCQHLEKEVFCPLESTTEFSIKHLMNAFLIVFCALYARRIGRHLPYNLHKPNLIIISCLVTAGFFLFYFLVGTDSHGNWSDRAFYSSWALSLIALMNSLILFGDNLLVILKRTEEIHRAYYSTATGMRCFIGNTESGCRALSSVNTNSVAGSHTTKTIRYTNKKRPRLCTKKKRPKRYTKKKKPKCSVGQLLLD